MQDASTRHQDIGHHAKTSPGDFVTITPAQQCAKPVPDHLSPEGRHCGKIAGDSMIVHVAPDHTAKPNPKVRNAVVEPTAQVLLDVVEFGPQALRYGLAFDSEAVPFAGLSTYVGKAQEIKRLRLPLPQALALGSGSRAKLDQASFVRMQRKAEMLQAFPKVAARKRSASERC